MFEKDIREKLILAAIDVQKKSYSPYSNYAVGAALLSDSGDIYTGTNVENAVYPVTMCAERSAVFKAVSEGEQTFKAIAVVTRDGGSPCGSCRQVLAEFGLDIILVMADELGKIKLETTVGDLLPHSFGPSNIQGG